MGNRNHDGGQKRPDTDQERGEIRGNQREADFEPGSDEGQVFTGEIGSRGDDTSLRGHSTGGLTPKNPKVIDRKNENLQGD